MPTAEPLAPLDALRRIPWCAALWLGLALLPSCAWESASGPGSGASRADVDARLAELVGVLPRPEAPADADHDADRDANAGAEPRGPDDRERGDAAAWPRPTPAVPRAPYAVRLEVDRLAHEHRDHAAAQWAAAVLAFEVADHESARARVDRVLALEPDHVGARVLAARIAVQFGNLDAAARTIGDGLSRRPDAGLLHEADAWVAFLGGEHLRARAALVKAERLGIPPARIWFNRGLIAEAEGDESLAVSAWRTCLEHDPRHAGAQRRLRALGVAPAAR